MPEFKVVQGDNRLILKKMKPDSIHAIITDPPYELGFMGKSWDSTGIAYDVELWKLCLHVLKPGGHLLAFGAPRNYHRLAVAIEDAGFEIRDSIHWIYGSGFPKSLDVGKKTEGQWNGWGTGLRPAHEPIVLARKPFSSTVAVNVLTHGTGAINIDASRVGVEERVNNASEAKAVTGRTPTNLVFSHLPECVETGTEDVTRVSEHRIGNQPDSSRSPIGMPTRFDGMTTREKVVETVPTFDCAPGCPVAELDASEPQTISRPYNDTGVAVADSSNFNAGGTPRTPHLHNDSGGKSRYFPVFKYNGKATSKEKPRDAEGKTHTTIKPLALMQWLVRLVTPPNGIILDPFAGSGTTLEAAYLEGFHSIGIELEPSYIQLINARMAGVRS